MLEVAEVEVTVENQSEYSESLLATIAEQESKERELTSISATILFLRVDFRLSSQ